METTHADWEIDITDIKIISEIDSSSNSVVYLCYWRTHQIVVMKVIEGNAENELRVLSKCLHPRICQFLGACVQRKKTFILFEYMPRGNLRTFVKIAQTRRTKLSVALDISVALEYLSHRKPVSILHRDIKPENILIGENNIAKICDFGISKMDLKPPTSPKKHTGEVGTVRWSAPEVLLSQPYNDKSDVYSYGLLLKYLWSGILPYNEYEMPFQAAFAKVNNISDDLSVIDDVSIRELVERCVSFDPHERPSHSEVASVLNELLLLC